MFVSTQTVKYYETDQMGIVHHSNFIRYCETARIEFLYSMGLDFAEFERSGFVSPVISFNIEFKSPAVFGDTLKIKTSIKELKGIRIWFEYVIENQDGKLLSQGQSCHTFCDKNLKPVAISKARPEIYQKLHDEAFKQQ